MLGRVITDLCAHDITHMRALIITHMRAQPTTFAYEISDMHAHVFIRHVES